MKIISKQILIVTVMTIFFVQSNAQTKIGDIYNKAIGSTVTVETDIGFGSGFFCKR